jgi:hypothetical protein
MMHKHKSRPASSRRDIVEGSIGIVLTIGLLVGIAILIYQRSTSTGSFRGEYKGKIIDKRISVLETNEGSRFAKELIVEAAGGHQFTVSVTQEIYDRAKAGMLIQRTPAKGIELLPDPKRDYSGE